MVSRHRLSLLERPFRHPRNKVKKRGRKRAEKGQRGEVRWKQTGKPRSDGAEEEHGPRLEPHVAQIDHVHCNSREIPSVHVSARAILPLSLWVIPRSAKGGTAPLTVPTVLPPATTPWLLLGGWSGSVDWELIPSTSQKSTLRASQLNIDQLCGAQHWAPLATGSPGRRVTRPATARQGGWGSPTRREQVTKMPRRPS